jgi:DNA-directed RNA polymerase specialized sigma24 family protein
MSDKGSVSLWIARLKEGEEQAAQALWERYFRRLVNLARAMLRWAPRLIADEEDVALSAFDSFFRGAEEGRFPQLDDRDDLWQLLMVLTARKAANLTKYELRAMRDPRRLRRPSGVAGHSTRDDILAWWAGKEPTPESAAQVADECRRLLDKLGDPGLRAVALAKMEGYTNAEIAQQLGCVVSTVERRLKTIRRIWKHEEATP